MRESIIKPTSGIGETDKDPMEVVDNNEQTGLFTKDQISMWDKETMEHGESLLSGKCGLWKGRENGYSVFSTNFAKEM